jgi:hypothetical protein
VTRALGLVGGRVTLRLLAAGRELHTMVASPARTPEVPATVGAGHVQPGHGAERSDAVAGSEFLDDHIRLRD